MTHSQPTIDDILRRFFDDRRSSTAGLTRRRIDEIEHMLRECIEVEADRILVTRDLLIVAAEREFSPHGAVARTMHADDLVFILSIFVTAPWLPLDLVQRGKQLNVTGALTDYLVGQWLVDRHALSCPLLDIRCGIDRERQALRRERQPGSVGPM